MLKNTIKNKKNAKVLDFFAGSGTTGHAEIVEVVFDPDLIPFETLLEVFFPVHDPTQLNRQGNDVGTQYRSCIMPTSEQQRRNNLQGLCMDAEPDRR